MVSVWVGCFWEGDNEGRLAMVFIKVECATMAFDDPSTKGEPEVVRTSGCRSSSVFLGTQKAVLKTAATRVIDRRDAVVSHSDLPSGAGSTALHFELGLANGYMHC